MIHSFFFFNDTATTEIYTLSLHDALPISGMPYRAHADRRRARRARGASGPGLPFRRGARTSGNGNRALPRSEEHTSELQSQSNLVCRLLLEKKKKKQTARDVRSHVYIGVH